MFFGTLEPEKFKLMMTLHILLGDTEPETFIWVVIKQAGLQAWLVNVVLTDHIWAPEKIRVLEIVTDNWHKFINHKYRTDSNTRLGVY